MDKLEQRMEKVEKGLEKADLDIRGFSVRIGYTELRMHDVEKHMDSINEAFGKVRIGLENEVIPQLNTIQDCYLGTYERYASSIERLDTMQADIDALKITVQHHSKLLA